MWKQAAAGLKIIQITWGGIDGEEIEYVSACIPSIPGCCLQSSNIKRVRVSGRAYGGHIQYRGRRLCSCDDGRQLYFAANLLNNGFYGWRTGAEEFDHLDGRLERPDLAGMPGCHRLYKIFRWGSICTCHQFGRIGKNLHRLSAGVIMSAIQTPYPDSLQQPELRLPFLPGEYGHIPADLTQPGERLPLAAIVCRRW